MQFSLRIRILVLLLGITGASTGTLTFFAAISLESAVRERELANAANMLDMVTLHLDEIYNSLYFLKEKSISEKKEVLKNVIDLSIFYADSINISVEKGLLSRQAAQRIVLGNISRVRFNNDDYLFVMDPDYKILGHPDPQVVGEAIFDQKDSRGNYIARGIVEKVLKEGSAFSTYYWQREEGKEPELKLTYWVYYPRWKWIIAGGFYFDDIEHDSLVHLTFILEEIKKTFGKLQIGGAGYLFLFTGNKKMLIHPTLGPDDDFAGMKNPVTGGMIADELMAAALRPGGKFEYVWDKPEFENHFRFKKLAIVTYFEQFDYYVVYTVYEDDITLPAWRFARTFFFIALGFLVLISILAVVLSNALISPIRTLILLMSRIKEKGFVEFTIPGTNMKEITQLGGIFSSMIGSIRGAHEKLEQANKNIIDSIRYAGLIQTSILPGNELLAAHLPDSFVLWEPRDIVSGDFYQIYPLEDGFFLFLGDCTGHGVPGGFLTMFCVSALRRIIFSEHIHDPGTILLGLHGMIQEALGNSASESAADDGLDGGICYIKPREGLFLFAGARSTLFVANPGEQVCQIKGDRASMGYKRTKADVAFQTHRLSIRAGSCYYLTTDGLLDQTGGELKFSFGRKRFLSFIEDAAGRPFKEQKVELVRRLKRFQGESDRLDDVTVIGFSL